MMELNVIKKLNFHLFLLFLFFFLKSYKFTGYRVKLSPHPTVVKLKIKIFFLKITGAISRTTGEVQAC